MAAIAETVWQYQQQYESALDAFFEFKATGKVASAGPKLDMDRVEKLEKENVELKATLAEVLKRLAALEGNTKVQAAPAAAGDAEEDDDDVDLFGSDDEDDAEAEKIKAERVAAYNARKAAKEEKKGKVIAKSNIIFDVKPWDDETDMAELEANVRTIEMDGLLWGTGKLVAIGYGIKKLQITCVIEDDKVSTDLLEENITNFEDYVQSVDVVAFNKI
ncbi:Oidioi.mRNA.OKI2018_I69.chr2.g7004.t1.cds [Oikopleura dioica]|uniref:Oidioi.mRNA.OKI2018_I69.chr2.g7004.t1.cds n=1 Tax=Oikopleura dioica TaxID=34765 RepID=A0ABN7T583_OIKDI|nr:Oidioi.mRNA.OKI2018_I69.chr2.g7004.t1.cds [Oikopleura dioica]